MRAKTYIAIGLLVGVLAAVVWLVNEQAWEFGSAMGCTDSVLSKVDSPDGKLSAIVFRRQCGATAPDSTQANIQPAGSHQDARKYQPFVVVDGAPTLGVTWDSPVRLTVSGITSERVYRQESLVDNIQINYR